MATRKGTIAEQVAQIRKRLGHLDIQWSPAHWLDLGTEEVNRVFGHKELGMAYGRIVEIAGLESNGKTALALTLCAIAQQEGAAIIWQDLENSFSEDWAAMRGLDTDAVALVRPRLVQESKKKGARLSSAEELCAEATTYMDELAYEKAILVVDSIPSMQTALAQEAGSDKQNMRTKMDLPMFLSQQLRDWINRAVARNVMIVLINQLRQQPNVPFGDPWYTPGGNAVRFYSHVRLRIRRGGSKRELLDQRSRQRSLTH